MKLLVVWVEPASYVLDCIQAVYAPLGADCVFLLRRTEALSAEGGQAASMLFLRELPWPRRAWRLARMLARYDCVLFNGYNWPEFLWLWILNCFLKKKLGIMSDTQFRVPESKGRAFLKRCYLGMLFRSRHVFGLAGGTGSHRAAFTEFGMAARRVRLLPMVVRNHSSNASMPEKKASVPFRFLFVGRLVPVKNLEFLLSVFAEEYPEPGRAELHLVGDGPLRQNLEREYGKYPHVFFHGSRFDDALVQTYREASALLLISFHDQWGLVVNEAMSAGLPVIVSDGVGAHEDLVLGRDTGSVFPLGDRAALRRCLVDTAEDEEHYRRRSANAWRLIHEYWNFDLYRECLLNFLKTEGVVHDA